MQRVCKEIWEGSKLRYEVVDSSRDLDSVVVRQAFIECCSELKDFDKVETAKIIGKSYETVTRAVRTYERGEGYTTPLYFRARKYFRRMILQEETTNIGNLLIHAIEVLESTKSDIDKANNHLSHINRSISTDEIEDLIKQINISL